MKVQLATINVNGLARSDKVKTIGQWVKKQKIQCVMVQEMTRGDGNIAQNIRSGHWANGQWVIEKKLLSLKPLSAKAKPQNRFFKFE